MFEVSTSCTECGAKGKATTDNPAVIHKSIVCNICQLDWEQAFIYFENTRKNYQELAGMPGVNTTLALEHVFRPIAERYAQGERSVELYQEMISVE